MPSKLAFFRMVESGSEGRLRFLVQWNPAALWLMKTCICPVEITNEGTQNLPMKILFEGATVIYGLQPRKTVRTSDVKVGMTKLLSLASKHRNKFSTDHSSGKR